MRVVGGVGEHRLPVTIASQIGKMPTIGAIAVETACVVIDLDGVWRMSDFQGIVKRQVVPEGMRDP
ncbi:MAG: hypothetical protein R2843_13240 [Thermomicrobiales bacterium]